MKRKYLLFITLLTSLMLMSCQDDDLEDELDTGFDVIYDTGLDYDTYLSDANPLVKMTIQDYGDIYIELFPQVAKITVDNFIAYIESNAYVGSTFHRVINNFMIQGGIVDDTACAIIGEFSSNGVTNSLSHYPGVIAMARTGFPNSATSQFFINDVYNAFLTPNYAAFGGVVFGFDIVEQISEVSTNSIDMPYENVIIDSVSIDYRGYEPSPRECHENS